MKKRYLWRIILTMMIVIATLLNTVYDYPTYSFVLFVLTLVILFVVLHFEKKEKEKS
ncbi:hypothetical protein [Aquibacillus rhizosphaerae]|uniref:Uncharacterized protein n=1 Tax=Aquibacillus rhizosphaerae TaxID=3051431 RepID=A0ABT7L8Y4_9BACI|nr:hypothetical protein [Aquibacillus sp. LR5S19]MDL4842336.1 hypothetical protein [Aquibacillus sp. LR5S19]